MVQDKDVSSDILQEQDLVNLVYHRFNNSLIVVLRDGTLVQIDLSTYELEVIGEQADGFLAAELSPCEELLVLATGANSLVLFDKEFNIIDEKPLDDGEGTPADLKIDHCKIVWRFDSNVVLIEAVL